MAPRRSTKGMKKPRRKKLAFKVRLPASVPVIIHAFDQSEAIRKAKLYECISIPITFVPIDLDARNQQTMVEFNKYVHGVDAMSLIEEEPQ